MLKMGRYEEEGYRLERGYEIDGRILDCAILHYTGSLDIRTSGVFEEQCGLILEGHDHDLIVYLDIDNIDSGDIGQMSSYKRRMGNRI